MLQKITPFRPSFIEWGRWLLGRNDWIVRDAEDYLFRLVADGSGKQARITSFSQEGQLANPAWAPDGKRLLVVRATDGALVILDMQAVAHAMHVQL